MPRMYVYTLRKPDGELVYLLKPVDENPAATTHLLVENITSEPVLQQAAEEEVTSSAYPPTDDVIEDGPPGVANPEDTTEIPAEANEEVEHMSVDDTCDSESAESCDAMTEDQPIESTSPRPKGIQVIEQPVLETAPPPQQGGEPVISPSGILPIPRETWASFLPEGQGTLLKKGWTDMICKAYSVVNPYCVLRIKHSYKGKAVKRLQRYFWRAVALCKHTDCIQVEFLVKEYPVPGDVPLHFNVKGTFNHKEGEVFRRHIKGEERERIFQELKHLSPANIKQKLMSSADKSALNAGNHSSCPTLQAIRRIASDGRKKEERDSDMWRDLDAMAQEVNTPIRILCHKPFILAWHTQEQLQFLTTLRVREIYVGCTGDFVKELFGLPVYYYALIVRPGGGKPEFPITEMLTDCKRRSTVNSWLDGVIDDILEFASLDIRDGRTKVVVDGSEILRDGASWAFMGTSIKSYLENRIAARNPSYPSLRVCAVQEIHAAMEALSIMSHTLEGEETALRVIRALQMSANLDEALVIFKWASAVFNERFVNQKVSIAITNLERATSRVETLDLTHEPHKLTKIVIPDVCPNAIDPRESPYYSAFERAAELGSFRFRGGTQYENALFIPGFTEYLLKSHLAFFPLWSSGAPCSLANCITEKWFHFVKIDTLRRQKNVKPGRFFRSQVELVGAILKDAQKEQ